MYWKYASDGCGKGREGDENVQMFVKNSLTWTAATER